VKSPEKLLEKEDVMATIRPLIMANSLHGFTIHAADGALGRIEDFYFNDQTWKIYHVVADLGNWLSDRKVLLLPELLGHADWRKKFIEARTTRELIRNSPDSDTILPVGLQIEKQKNFLIMQEPFIPEALWGMHQYVEPSPFGERKEDPHLRSTRILKGCAIESDDHKSVGTILDFLIDTETWEIRFILLKADDSRVFLAQPGIVQSIDVANRIITITHPDDERKDWQEYDPHYMALLEIAQQ
jgi:hypothetical protein